MQLHDLSLISRYRPACMCVCALDSVCCTALYTSRHIALHRQIYIGMFAYKAFRSLLPHVHFCDTYLVLALV